jgi:preprotein translocase subunit SecF
VKLNLAEWGNQLHSGERTYAIVPKRRMWLTISAAALLLCILVLVFRGLNFGVDFTGGNVYQISDVANPDPKIAEEVVAEYAPEQEPRISILGENDIHVKIGVVDIETARAIEDGLQEGYDATDAQMTSEQIGPTFGAEVGKKAIQSLIVFLVLVALVMTVYFRAWRMAVAGIIALLHDLIFTVGIYALVGFEVTPASVIGFLTILGYSLYDTVVVFDKVRENTENLTAQHRYTYDELANLALNQTLVRSINTTVVALLPVGAILFIGAFVLGAGTLKDIALALFVGMAVGAYSSIFVATPLEVTLRDREARIKKHTEEVLALRASGKTDVVVDDAGNVRVGALQPGGHKGQGAQPKRKSRK